MSDILPAHLNTSSRGTKGERQGARRVEEAKEK